MKKCFVLLIVVLFSSLTFSQSEFSYGLKVGLSASNIDVKNLDRDGLFIGEERFNSYSLNPSVGLFLTYDLHENVFLEAEMSYLQKGSRNTEKITYGTFDEPDKEFTSYYTSGVDLRYIELAININPRFNIGTQPIYLIIGSTFNYNIAAISIMHRDLVKSNLGYKLGIGAQFDDLIKLPIRLEIKYMRDFDNFDKFNYADLTNQLYLFNVGLIF